MRAINKESARPLRAFGAVGGSKMKTANDTTEVRGGISSRPMQDWILFAAICPKCRRPVLQHGYSRVLLFCFLDVDHPIEAFCTTCDEFWLISADERRAIRCALSPLLERRPVSYLARGLIKPSQY